MFSLVQKDSGYGDNVALTPKDTNNNGDTILVSYGFFTMIKLNPLSSAAVPP